MSNWLDRTLAQTAPVDDWLAPRRQSALAQLRQQPWPGRKTEAWKYTPLTALSQASFAQRPPSQVQVLPMPGVDSIDLVFINGQLQAVPGDLPAGLRVIPFGSASEQDQAWALDTFARIKPQAHLFGLVNDILAAGLLIDVAPGASIVPTLRVVNIITDQNEAHSRIVVRLGEEAHVSVIEHAMGDQYSFNTAFAEYRIGAGAQLEHYRLALQGGQAMSIGGSHFDLATAARLNSSLIGFGNQLSRLDLDIIHSGEHANACLNAIYLLDGQELFDLHCNVEHVAANGTTEVNARGIMADHACAVFSGRIHIHRNAQKTQAELNNRNLLLSADAQINTKPELEIYADDVRCAHGATIAETDQQALFYLQSRGIDRERAQQMLNFGFVNELVERMPNTGLLAWAQPTLQQRFARMQQQ